MLESADNDIKTVIVNVLFVFRKLCKRQKDISRTKIKLVEIKMSEIKKYTECEMELIVDLILQKESSVTFQTQIQKLSKII